MGTTKLQELAKQLVVYNALKSPTDAFSKKVGTKYEKARDEAEERLKNQEVLPENSPIALSLRWSDEAVNWARKMILGIKEFKQAYPEYGEILEEMINVHKKGRRAYLEFKVKSGNLPDEEYIEGIMEFGIGKKEAIKVYESVKILESIKKKRESSKKALVDE